MRSLLVTGGAGFIGSRFVRAAAVRGVRTIVVDSLTYAGSLDNLAGLLDPGGAVTFVRADIADRERVRALLASERPDAVVNFAAETHVDRSIDDPAEFIRTNVTGAFELLEASRRHLDSASGEERERFRFIQISTDEVFGSLGETDAPFNEQSPFRPNSPYAASKAAADLMARAYRETYGLPVIITNCSNNFGPNQHPEKLIPLMILHALGGRDLPIYGDGENIRDWLYVDDHCEALWAVLERGRPGATYAIGAGNGRRNTEVVDRLCDLLERERPAAANPALKARGLDSYRGLKTLVTDRRGHDRRYAIDSRRIRAELGWAPRHGFEEALAATVRWYLEHGARVRA